MEIGRSFKLLVQCLKLGNFIRWFLLTNLNMFQCTCFNVRSKGYLKIYIIFCENSYEDIPYAIINELLGFL